MLCFNQGQFLARGQQITSNEMILSSQNKLLLYLQYTVLNI